MINSVNTLDILKPQLLDMENFNAANSAANRLHHNNATPLQHNIAPSRAYLTFITKTSPANALEAVKPPALMAMQPQRQERVKVQRLESHTKLQNNNCWNNFRTLYNLSASSSNPILKDSCTKAKEDAKELKVEVNDVDGDIKQKQQQQPQIDIQNKSAFNIELNNRYINSNRNLIINNNNLPIAAATETNRLNCNKDFYAKQEENDFINGEQQTVMIFGPSANRRTEDQEHAYRRIESVHNYAKLKTYNDDDELLTSNGSRHSSNIEDDEDDDDGEDDEDDEEDDDDAAHNGRRVIFDVEEDETIDLDEDYEDILNRRRFPKIKTSVNNVLSKKGVKSSAEKYHTNLSNQQIEDEIDVETIEHPKNTSITGTEMSNIISSAAGESPLVKPDHHARRPMNAFLIFCKRHRAIVKERYKTLENRAITKILGDWWASLEANDKECFTNLAQQNKDAFFSANPNFKWYKLPAPPLRTLSTRPTNGVMEYETSIGSESICNNTRSNCNFFKLADEAQMGDLSQLMQDKSRHKQCAALQQALGETSHFMNTHLMGDVETADTATTQSSYTKRQHFNDNNSFSSNSSEDDGLVPKIKSARSCKGKRYQELINSGQITAPAVKKSKSSQRLSREVINLSSFITMNVRPNFGGANESIISIKNGKETQRLQESDNVYTYDYAPFDLEEKIKELPALCLDNYLQRKRNTKKKKKLSSNGKKRGGGGGNRNGQTKNVTLGTKSITNPSLSNKMPMEDMMARMQQRKQQQQAVGSQKRKARKESITRRDVSAIEQEVASLLPLTINGCCYFQEAPITLSPTYNNDIVQKDKPDIFCRQTTSPIIPMITSTTSINSSLPLSSSGSLVSKSTSSSSSSVSDQTVNVNTAIASEFSETSVAIVKIEKSDELNDNISSSTSDLLILAEVAANRTEFKH